MLWTETLIFTNGQKNRGFLTSRLKNPTRSIAGVFVYCGALSHMRGRVITIADDTHRERKHSGRAISLCRYRTARTTTAGYSRSLCSSTIPNGAPQRGGLAHPNTPLCQTASRVFSLTVYIIVVRVLPAVFDSCFGCWFIGCSECRAVCACAASERARLAARGRSGLADPARSVFYLLKL